MNTIHEERLEKYLEITERAIDDADVHEGEGGDEALDTARRYLSDAKHFRDEGDLVTAFAAVNYAHGWLDCAARLGMLDVDEEELFAVDV